MTCNHFLHAMLAAIISIAFACSASATDDPSVPACDIAQIKNVRDLTQALSERAVEIVNLAASTDWKNNSRLAYLVPEGAKFSLGAGDIVRPLGKGVAGARELVEKMGADGFRASVWTNIPRLVDACSGFSVEVEFVDSDSQSNSMVTFDFLEGKLVTAKGWAGAFNSGPVSAVSD